MKKFLTSALCALSVLAVSHAAQADDIWTILERNVQSPPSLPPAFVPYRYVVDVQIAEGENKEDDAEEDEGDTFSAQIQVDPSLPAGQRATVISASDEDYPSDLKELLKEVNDLEMTDAEQADAFWCEGGDNEVTDENLSQDDFTIISQDERQAIIRPNMEKLADLMMDSDDEEMSSSDRKMAKKLTERLDGEFLFSKPDGRLRSFKIWMTRPMTVKIIAKIKTMDVEQVCAMAPNGFLYISDMNVAVTGKALGMSFRQDMKIKVSDLQPL